MSLLHEAIIADKYGLRLTVQQLAEALNMATSTVRNQIAQGTFGVPTYVDGGKRWCDYRDLARYFDDMRARAKTSP